MRNHYVVVNAAGLVFAGVSTISGNPLWFDCAGDLEHMVNVGALRVKRDARWLALAQRYEPAATWQKV